MVNEKNGFFGTTESDEYTAFDLLNDSKYSKEDCLNSLYLAKKELDANLKTEKSNCLYLYYDLINNRIDDDIKTLESN